jgi:hypothetical protein
VTVQSFHVGFDFMQVKRSFFDQEEKNFSKAKFVAFYLSESGLGNGMDHL